MQSAAHVLACLLQHPFVQLTAHVLVCLFLQQAELEHPAVVPEEQDTIRPKLKTITNKNIFFISLL